MINSEFQISSLIFYFIFYLFFTGNEIKSELTPNLSPAALRVWKVSIPQVKIVASNGNKSETWAVSL